MLSIDQIASSFVGQRELPDSMGFEDQNFQYQMQLVGWKPGLLWCGFFAKLVLTKYYEENSLLKGNIELLFKDKIVEAFKAFDENELFLISRKPAPGAIGFFKWENTRSKEGGTAVIVTEVTDKFYSTIELHYKKEVLEVVRSQRKRNRPAVSVGLNLLGFLHPILLTK